MKLPAEDFFPPGFVFTVTPDNEGIFTFTAAPCSILFIKIGVGTSAARAGRPDFFCRFFIVYQNTLIDFGLYKKLIII